LGAPREMIKAFVTDLLSKLSSKNIVREKVLDFLLRYGVPRAADLQSLIIEAVTRAQAAAHIQSAG
jgi:hypothetical protein